MSAVSVVIPFHNRVGWTVEAVRSVLEGTFEDFEVVLVDDGSTEDVTPLLRLRDERVRYVRQENKGASAARNLGLTLARGRYIAFLDSDDLFLPGKLEKQVALMDRHLNMSISHTSYQLMNEEGTYLRDVRAGRYSGQVYPRIYTDSHYIATPTVMVRRDALDGARFNELVRYGEDTLFWVGCLKRSELLGIDESLAWVRIHGRNAIHNPDAQLEGTISLMRHGVAEDKDLPFLFRRRLISGQCITVSRRYLKKWDRANALGFAFRAMVAWPFSPYVYKFLLLLVYKLAAEKAKNG